MEPTVAGDSAQVWVEYIRLAELVSGPVLRDSQIFYAGNPSPIVVREPIKIRAAIELTRSREGWSIQPMFLKEPLVTPKAVAVYLGDVRGSTKDERTKRRAEVALNS